jgi:hypothetical protein
MLEDPILPPDPVVIPGQDPVEPDPPLEEPDGPYDPDPDLVPQETPGGATGPQME